MSSKIEFTRNYNDLSTNQGFQFEFYCDRCGTGYRTRFHPSTLGRVTEVLGAASGLLGGFLGRAADLGERARSATWEKAHDEAFLKSMEELRPDFTQCPHCSSWVCQKSCWSTERGLCKQCAPDLGVEMAAAQSQRTRDAVWEKAQVAEEDQEKLQEENWREEIRATCPHCHAALSSPVKFCPECGQKIQAQAFCAECGAKLTPGTKFCPECGKGVAP